MATSRQGRDQFFGSSTSYEAAPYEKVACPNCRSDASAYKTVFDNEGTNWQTTCFECGQVTGVTPDGKVVRQLRHKCRVRYRLG
jgi:hypothetical protein